MNQAHNLSSQTSPPRPKFKLLTPKQAYLPDVLTLHKIGWNLSSIAKHVSTTLKKSTTQTIFLVKVVIDTCDVKPLSFAQLLPLLPLDEFIDTQYLEEFRSSLLILTSAPRPKQPLSDYDIHILKILVLLGWKKRRVADLLQISPTMVSIYTSDLTPWTYDEIKQLLPSLFTTSTSSNFL